MSDTQMDLVPAEEMAVVNFSEENQMMLAIVNSGNVEAFDKFLKLKEREEERLSQKLFEENFAKMQQEFKPVEKKKQGHNSKYAPLEVLQRAHAPMITKYGFSYRWNEEAVEGGKRVTLYVSGYGHTKATSFDVPFMDGNKSQNQIQVAGTMSTYGKRYTFCSGFGIILEGEDTDGYMPTPKKDPKEEWRDGWIDKVDRSNMDHASKLYFMDKITASFASGSQSQAKEVMDEIKAAIDG